MRLVNRQFLTYLCAFLIPTAFADNAEQKTHQLAMAEQFIDAFYSYDPSTLSPLLHAAPNAQKPILYYQGWAQGGNYAVVNRPGCEHTKIDTVVCDITVEDDLMKALEVDFQVTDTFALTFEGQTLANVETSSNDLDIFRAAQRWVMTNQTELIAAPCKDFFNGGLTPQDCVKAMVQGFSLYTKTDAFQAQRQALTF